MKNHRGLVIQMTGLSGSGKSTVARGVRNRLNCEGYNVQILDGDKYREGLCKDLGFSKEDRMENIRRLGFVANVLQEHSIISIIAAINPYEEVRQELKQKYNAKVVYVKCGLDECRERDPKGLYARTALPKGDPDKIWNFTGIDDPFEEPDPDFLVRTDTHCLMDCESMLIAYIKGLV